jgi:hypothetical protein
MPQRFEFGVQAYFGLAHNPLHLNLTDPKMGYSEQPFNLVNSQLTVDLGFYLGLWDFLSLAVMMPMGVNSYDENAVGNPTVPQLPSASNPTGAPIATGLYRGQPKQTIGISNAGVRDPRLALKARFYGGKYFELGSVVEGTLPLGDSNSFFGEAGPTLRPRLLGGVLLSRFTLALSFGGIVRGVSELDELAYSPPAAANSPPNRRLLVGNELTWGAGVSVLAHQVVSLSLEAFGTIPVGAGAGDPVSATGSLLGAIAVRPTEKWAITLAGGGGVLANSPRNADGRLLVGVAYSVSPREGGLR